MESRRFQRCIEDFICERCGYFVIGNGYTDHCSRCLWSKHVDIFPGDRASGCRGMMRPVGIEERRGQNVIVFQCRRCGYKQKNTANKEDSLEEIIHIA